MSADISLNLCNFVEWSQLMSSTSWHTEIHFLFGMRGMWRFVGLKQWLVVWILVIPSFSMQLSGMQQNFSSVHLWSDNIPSRLSLKVLIPSYIISFFPKPPQKQKITWFLLFWHSHFQRLQVIFPSKNRIWRQNKTVTNIAKTIFLLGCFFQRIRIILLVTNNFNPIKLFLLLF